MATVRRPRAVHPQADLFAAAKGLPEGFVYRPEVISADEEKHFAEWFALLPFAPFEFHGYLGHRRVVSFGSRYDYTGNRLRQAEELPRLLMPLRERAAQVADLVAKSLQQILVTEYPPGAAIGWHRDKPVFEDVIALSFLAPCVLRFRRPHGDGWDRRSCEVMPRSAYVLRGPSRREWEHSITATGSLRYSVTFRTLGQSPPLPG